MVTPVDALFLLGSARPGRRAALSSAPVTRAESFPMAKEDPMKLASLVLLSGLAVAGFATAQTPSQSAAPPAATAPPAESSDSGKINHACKKEIVSLCGHAHGQEM